jgi:E3 ubiquitin-protein ligase HUWE1
LSGAADSLSLKKKAATANQAQLVLVALVSKTGENPVDRHRQAFEYDDEPDLLFVRKFVLDTVLKAYKDAATPGEPFDSRYAKMLCLAELMSQMIGEKEKDPPNPRGTDPSALRSQMQLKRLMYEKGYLSTLTASIADIDLTFPNVKRTIKYILRVLRTLTKTAIQLSQSNIITSASTENFEDEIASASSLSDLEDDREETPDLYRNSALGMLEPGREEDFSEDSEDGNQYSLPLQLADILIFADDEEMYDDEYDDEIDYGEEISEDGEVNVSDEDEELGEMGEIEGLPGDPGVVEVIMGEEDDDDDDDDEMDEDDDEDTSDEDDDEDMGSEDMDEVEDQIEIVDEEGNPLDDDGASGWESDADDEQDGDEAEIDYEVQAQDLDEVQIQDLQNNDLRRFGEIVRAAIDGDDIDGEEIRDLQDRYIDEDGEQAGQTPL